MRRTSFTLLLLAALLTGCSASGPAARTLATSAPVVIALPTATLAAAQQAVVQPVLTVAAAPTSAPAAAPLDRDQVRATYRERFQHLQSLTRVTPADGQEAPIPAGASVVLLPDRVPMFYAQSTLFPDAVAWDPDATQRLWLIYGYSRGADLTKIVASAPAQTRELRLSVDLLLEDVAAGSLVLIKSWTALEGEGAADAADMWRRACKALQAQAPSGMAYPQAEISGVIALSAGLADVAPNWRQLAWAQQQALFTELLAGSSDWADLRGLLVEMGMILGRAPAGLDLLPSVSAMAQAAAVSPEMLQDTLKAALDPLGSPATVAAQRLLGFPDDPTQAMAAYVLYGPADLTLDLASAGPMLADPTGRPAPNGLIGSPSRRNWSPASRPRSRSSWPIPIRPCARRRWMPSQAKCSLRAPWPWPSRPWTMRTPGCARRPLRRWPRGPLSPRCRPLCWQPACTTAILQVRSHALVALLESGANDAIVEGLIAALGREEGKHLWITAVVIRRLGPAAAPALPALTAVLAAGDVPTVAVAAYSLGEMGEAARPALPALADVFCSRPGLEPLLSYPITMIMGEHPETCTELREAVASAK